MWLTARTRTGIRPGPTVAAMLAVALVASACVSPVSAPGASGQHASDDRKPLDRIHQQAEDALIRWADAVRASGGATITFVGDLTGQIGTWEADVGDNNKSALLAGMIVPVTELATVAPSRREVSWLDGSKVDVGVLSAAQAFEELVAAGSGDCPDCRPLRVTEANLATGLAETSRGPAEVPMWVFGLAGTSVRVTRVAVDDSITVIPPPWNADDPPVGLRIDWAIGAEDSRDLEVGFIGAAEDASKPCGVDYEPEAVESELAVVVIVHARPNPSPANCTGAGFQRTASVRLDSRLGERAVLEVQQGLPVPIRAP